MMTIDKAKEAGELLKEIEKHEELRADYLNAAEIVIGLPSGVPVSNVRNERFSMAGEEIGDQIIRVLDQRIANMRAKLQKLGVE